MDKFFGYFMQLVPMVQVFFLGALCGIFIPPFYYISEIVKMILLKNKGRLHLWGEDE